MPRRSAVLRPNLGLYTTGPSLTYPKRALSDGLNFRIQNGRLTNTELGWLRFGDFTLNGPVKLVDNFFIRGLDERLIFGTITDLYRYDTAGDAVFFITPIYSTGTAAASGTAVTGTGTAWDANVKAGDEIAFGANDENDPDADWFVIDTVDSDTGITLEASAGTVVDGPYTIRQLFTGTVSDEWDTEVFVDAGGVEDLWLATNGIDFVVKWNGLDAQVTVLSALGFRAKRLSVFQNMMIYGNLVQAGESKPADIINSNVGDPEDVSSGLSEQFRVVGEPGEIIEMKGLGDNLAIHLKDNDNIILTQFVGDPLIFVFRKASSGISAAAKDLVVDMGDHHLFVARDAQYRFDGASVIDFGNQYWPETLRFLDTNRLHYAFAHKDREFGSIYWVLPRTTDPLAGEGETAAPAISDVNHFLEEVARTDPMPVSRRAFPFISSGIFFQQEGVTWDNVEGAWNDQVNRWDDRGLFAAFPMILVGATDGTIYSINTSNRADGVALSPSFVRFTKSAIGDGQIRGLVSRVYPFARDPIGVDTSLGVSLWLFDHEYGEPTQSDVLPFDLSHPEGAHFVTPYRRARYIEHQFESIEGSLWEIEGFDTDVRTGGRR